MVKEAGTSAPYLKRPKTSHRAVRPNELHSHLLAPIARIAKSAGELLRLRSSPEVYKCANGGNNDALIDRLWTGDYVEAVGSLARSNPHLVQLLLSQSLDDAEVPRFKPRKTAMMPRFEGVLNAVFRERSQKTVPLFAAALSVRLRSYHVPRPVWLAIEHFAARLVMSPQWTEELCQEAVLRDPGAPYPTASGISAACFDNFTMTIGYGSYHTVESSGVRWDMTNWASISLPRVAIPNEVDITAIIQQGGGLSGPGMFRTDLDLQEFIDLFSPYRPEMVANREKRWRDMLTAARDGTLLSKHAFQSPYPPTHLTYHQPIWDRLQSSYEDVNFEIDLIRNSQYHCHSGAVMLGGDGLSYMRLVQRLAQDYRRYLWKPPVIIPQLGEHPHGTHHILNGHFRIWHPLIMRFATVVNNKQVKKDPEVSAFNASEHFYFICIRACAEYVAEISATGSDFRSVPQFLRQAEVNLSFGYVCYFLFYAGFMYVQFRNAVRENRSSLLDLLWCENLATARAANKTNYSFMSVLRVYWGIALVAPLRAAYHAVRSLRLIHTHVGWDYFIEHLNLLIRQGVKANITRELIEKFIREVNFTSVVNRGLSAVIKWNQAVDKATAKQIDSDVLLIKEFLRKEIGTTWAAATAASDANQLGVDLTDWGGQRACRRGAPWKKIQGASQQYRAYVEDVLGRYCKWHRWQ